MTCEIPEIQSLLTETYAAYDSFGEYYDLMYAAQGRKAGTYRHDVAEFYFNLIQAKGCNEILDCACGTGDPVIGLAVKDKFKITASDRSDRMLDKCTLNAQLEGLLHRQGQNTQFSRSNLEIVKACWQELPAQFGSNRFDMVMNVGHGFFHLISRENMAKALNSMVNVVRPGGYVIFDSKRWDENDDLHQEFGLEQVSWRKWVQTNVARLMFLNTTQYYDDPRGVDGVIQLKNFYVLEEISHELHVKSHSRFWGAPFAVPTALDMAREAGLVEVQEIYFDGMPDYMARYATIIGRKYK